jgi:bacteriocin-like protein
MTKHVERELANQVTELTANELEHVSGGGGGEARLVFTFKLVAVKTVSWAHDDE